jgi:excisionase family DNA binding protein
VTVEEVATALGLARATIRQQIGNGSIRAVKHGRDWWIEPEEVERYRRESWGKPGRRAKR